MMPTEPRISPTKSHPCWAWISHKVLEHSHELGSDGVLHFQGVDLSVQRLPVSDGDAYDPHPCPAREKQRQKMTLTPETKMRSGRYWFPNILRPTQHEMRHIQNRSLPHF